LSAALQRSYPFDIPCYVYGLPATTAGCINPSGNLAEIPLINYLVPGGGTGVNTSQGNVTGTARNAIPYSQAYAELSFTSGGGTKYWFGDQYYGNNNTYNRPAFLVASAGLTYPLRGGLREGSIQLAAYNLFNAYPKGYTEQDLGILIPTIAGQNPARPTLAGLTNGLNIGPTRFVIQFTRRIGN
jgi:hypothetical protein